MEGTPGVNESGEMDLVGRFLYEIGQVPMLNAEQEVALGERVKRGLMIEEQAYAELSGLTGIKREDELAQVDRDGLPFFTRLLVEAADDGREAQHQLVRANLRLVVSIAKRYPQTMPLLDRVQEGTFGLMRAAQKFDGSKGFKFSTYATWWIRREIGVGLIEGGRTIRLPAKVRDKFRAIARAEDNLKSEGTDPTPEAVADRMGVTVEELMELMEQVERSEVKYLDQPSNEAGDIDLHDIIADDTADTVAAALASGMRKDLHAYLDQLNPAEQEYLGLRFGLGGGPTQTLPQLAERYGCTKTELLKWERAIIRSLRTNESFMARFEGYAT